MGLLIPILSPTVAVTVAVTVTSLRVAAVVAAEVTVLEVSVVTGLTGTEAVLTVAVVILILVVVTRLDVDIVQNEAREIGAEAVHGFHSHLDHTAVGIAGTHHENVTRDQIVNDTGVTDLTNGRQVNEHHIVLGSGGFHEGFHVIRSKKLRGVGGNLTAGNDVQILIATVTAVDIMIATESCQNVTHTLNLIVQVENLMDNGATKVAVHQKHLFVHLSEGNRQIGNDQRLTGADVGRGDTVHGALLTLVGVAHIGTESLEGLGNGEGGLLIQQTAVVVTVRHEVTAVGALGILASLDMIAAGLVLECLVTHLGVFPRGDLTDNGHREAVLQVLLVVDGVIEVGSEEAEEVHQHKAYHKANDGIKSHVSAYHDNAVLAHHGNGLGHTSDLLHALGVFYAEIVVHGSGDRILHGSCHLQSHVLCLG